MEASDLDGLFSALVIFGLIIGGVYWVGWELIDWLWIDDAIKVSKPITPEIEIIVRDNVVDTLYVYRKP
jgi:hypothetical protein